MQVSSSITNISAALLKAQREIDSVKKTASNLFFKSKYADLTAVIEAVKDVLNKNDITILQPHHGTVVETILLHVSGEFIGSVTPIVCAKDKDPQALGSAISYARRYGLQSLICLPAEDDDGESAVERNVRPVTKSPVAKVANSKDF